MHTNVSFEHIALPAGGETPEVSFACDHSGLLRTLEFTLEQEYENIFSSIAQFRAAKLMDNAHALVIQNGKRVPSVFLFRIEKNRAVILNEAIHVSDDDLRRAARHIFNTYQSVSVIRWHAIQSEVRRLPFPFQRFNYSEDIVVDLPRSELDYLQKLGKATRKNLIRHRNRIKRDHPSFQHQVFTGDAIEESLIRQIVNFNRARMAGKHKVCGFHEQEVERLIALSKTHGLVSVVTIGGIVAGGSICHRVGANYFMEISAHDPAYDDYRLGTLCCYLCICAAIARGGRELHLLWGRDDYKYMLLGQQRDLYNVLIYRSRVRMLLNGGLALKAVLQAYVRKEKLWLSAVDQQGGFAARIVRRGLAWLRTLPHLRFRRA